MAEQRTMDLEGCEQARQVLESAVTGIRARLQGLSEQTEAALGEEQARLRRTTAEVRALRQSTCQTEARVQAMRRFKAERVAAIAARRRELSERDTAEEL